MKLRTFLFVALLAGLLSSCGGITHRQPDAVIDSLTFAHARLLHVYQMERCRLAVVMNPWKPSQELHRYVLVDEDENPRNLPQGTIIKIPLRHVAAMVTIHAALMTELGALSQLSGICDKEYIQNTQILEALQNKTLEDFGNSFTPNIEKMMSSHSDGILVSPFEGTGYGAMETTGVPIIECADYMELSALGRAEWMKFYGMLIGKEREADSVFAVVERNYQSLSHRAMQAGSSPTLLSDMMNGAAWYVPGGNSTIGRIYRDAGARYVFADRPENGSVRLAFETVYDQARDADVWFVKYGRNEDFTRQSFLTENPHYQDFKAFREGHVYGCNTFSLPFYEEEPFHPDRYLSDLVGILHPDLFPDVEPRYFHQLKDE